jgi:hypothetical protein
LEENEALEAENKRLKEEREALQQKVNYYQSHFSKEKYDPFLYLHKNNDNREWSAEDWINEFYLFLQTGEADKIKVYHKPMLSKDQAFTIIWYLQEHFPLLPDNIEQCDVCKDLYNSNSTGIYSEEGNEHGHNFCGSCDYLAPYDDEEQDDELPEPPQTSQAKEGDKE